MPPFARLAAIVLSANDSQRLHAAMQALAASRPNFRGVSVYGPSVAPLGFLRGKHRGRALIQVEKTVDIQAVIQGWLATVKLPSGCACRWISILTALSDPVAGKGGWQGIAELHFTRLPRLPFGYGYDSSHTDASALCALVPTELRIVETFSFLMRTRR